MSDFRRKSSMENYRRESALSVLEETLQRQLQSPSDGFRHTKGSWEQTAQERSICRGLINKGTAVYEKKRICEAVRKRR